MSRYIALLSETYVWATCQKYGNKNICVESVYVYNVFNATYLDLSGVKAAKIVYIAEITKCGYLYCTDYKCNLRNITATFSSILDFYIFNLMKE